ncbi:MAG: hypothetical protein QN152_06525 [Armatimonadota bacterium]|nr:hypothetical protein [Armatimonadota bacterium]MDR7426135.1 hypothetical protein [Armatimonadota bacterium]MDR7463508.1 hypothetical protein [Armatimonadota bacterium]MDR7475338.1 hypothetical protein [Armatimonadota bacterium]MDR7539176.1 hypothetical protein [Armatimonadota bacterium]
MSVSVLDRLTSTDLRFVAQTLLPEEDTERAARRLRAEEDLLDHLLEDDRLFRRLLAEETAIVRVSPWLLFSVLVRRVRRELQMLPYTVEQHGVERVAVFDAARAGELLADREIQDYLVAMLTSFTRTDSFLVEVEEAGRIRRRRFSDFSSEDMIALAGLMPEELRFPILRRIADIALFLTGIFPEYVAPASRAGLTPRPTRPWRVRRTLEELEDEGRRFYRLAARHEMARRTNMSRTLETLAETFPLARKPLNVMATKYIGTSRMLLFGAPA